MIEDRELNSWREQWKLVAPVSPEFQHKIQLSIRQQNRRFVLGNVLTAIVLIAILIFAVALRHQESWLGAGWAAGIVVLVFVSASWRIWAQRGTWRMETQSTRAFLELWRRRVLARLRLLRVTYFVVPGWIVFCAVLTAVNWRTVGPDVTARPKDWLEVLLASILMVPLTFLWVAWQRRRRVAELNEVQKMLDELKN